MYAEYNLYDKPKINNLDHFKNANFGNSKWPNHSTVINQRFKKSEYYCDNRLKLHLIEYAHLRMTVLFFFEKGLDLAHILLRSMSYHQIANRAYIFKDVRL